MQNLFYFRQISVVLLMAFAFLFSANIANACSCFSPSLDSAIEDSANIVILKLQAVEKYQEGEKGYGYGGVKQSKLTVEKVFKGNLKVGQELFFRQGGGGDCIWTFDERAVGLELLFFLGKKPADNDLWAAFICTRSNSVKWAAADLMYLEKMSKVKGKTRLSGTISQEDEPALEIERGSNKPLVGIAVTVSGNGKKYKLKTNEKGVYEIYDLPVGKYKVTPEKISGYRFNDDGKDSEEVEIGEEDLEEQDFEFTIDNSISGKLFDTNGKPLKDVCLDLLPTRGKKAEDFDQSDCTDANGSFKFDEIPIGTYIIVVNEDNKITADSPFGTFYYPNKINREEALAITIGPGNHFKDLIINAPNTAETITISGILLFADGKPVADETVEFYKNIEDISQIEQYERSDSTERTDENGRFTIRILKGQKGILFGSMYSYIGEYEKCPQLEKIIKEKGGSSDIETPAIQIEAVSDQIEVELKFPFSSCKKTQR